MSTAVAKGVRALVGSLAVGALAFACSSPDRDFGEVDAGAGGEGDDHSPAGTGGSGASSGSSGAGGSAPGGTSSITGGSAGGEPAAGDPCAMDPCINGGICAARGDQAVCTCDAAYEGEHCERGVDDCAESPCENGGECIDGTDAYTCRCAKGFSGAQCERAVSKCADDPCLNGGTCADNASGYACTCPAGFNGNNCEVNVDDCASSPCKNGGACVDGVNTFTCQCKAGYAGATCQTNINDCASNPCQNGSTCVDGVNAYTCQCKAGYSGATCQTNINDCASNPCQNGGSCVDGVNAYSCSCTNRYTGPKCEYLEVKLVPSTFLSGAYRTTATALSNDGKVLLMNLSDNSGAQGIARLIDFDEANTVPLSSPLSGGAGYGIDDDGSTLCGMGTKDDLDQAIKVVGTISSVLDLTPIGWQDPTSLALDVSADGTTTVGRLSAGGGTTSFYCKVGKACREVPMDAGGIVISANSVNGDGTVVVGHTFPADPTNGTGTAWRWLTTSAKATVLTLGGGTWALPSANGVSRDGKVVVGEVQINGVSHAVRWSGTSLTPGDLGAGRARATNADGSVTVGVDNSNVPIVWLGTTRQTLASLLGSNPDLSGATLTDLVAVSDDGKVVAGTAKIAGNDRAFMARLP